MCSCDSCPSSPADRSGLREACLLALCQEVAIAQLHVVEGHRTVAHCTQFDDGGQISHEADESRKAHSLSHITANDVSAALHQRDRSSYRYAAAKDAAPPEPTTLPLSVKSICGTQFQRWRHEASTLVRHLYAMLRFNCWPRRTQKLN